LLFVISHVVSKKDQGNDAFFKANKNSKWYLVAFGMIGTAISGITFISVPGEVGNTELQFKYFQFVIGCAIGRYLEHLEAFRCTRGHAGFAQPVHDRRGLVWRTGV
jgi:Na+/proline symporter